MPTIEPTAQLGGKKRYEAWVNCSLPAETGLLPQRKLTPTTVVADNPVLSIALTTICRLTCWGGMFPIRRAAVLLSIRTSLLGLSMRYCSRSPGSRSCASMRPIKFPGWHTVTTKWKFWLKKNGGFLPPAGNGEIGGLVWKVVGTTLTRTTVSQYCKKGQVEDGSEAWSTERA